MICGGVVVASLLGLAVASEFTDSLPYRVQTGIPMSWPGTDKGPVKCFDKGNLVSIVLSAYGFNPELSDPDSWDIQEYCHNPNGQRLGDISVDSIVSVFLPLSAPAPAANTSDYWLQLEEQAFQRAAATERSIKQRGRTITPIERQITRYAEVVRGLLEDPIAGPHLQKATSKYHQDPKEFYKELESSIAELDIPAPEVDVNLWRAFSQGQRELVINRAAQTLMAGLFTQFSYPQVEVAPDYWVWALELRGTGRNFAQVICEANEVALNTSPELAAELRCALQSVFHGMLACSPGPLDCAALDQRPWGDFSMCDRVTTQDDSGRLVSEIVPDLRLVVREEVVPWDAGEIPKAMMDQEGETYMFIWRATYVQAAWVSQAMCHKAELVPERLVPGWKVALELWTGPQGCTLINYSTLDAYPFASISEKEDEPCTFLVINRGTSSDCEWFYDVDGKLDPLLLDRHVELDLYANRGPLSLHNSIWPAARDYFVHEVLPRCPKVRVTVGGHSLGGSMTQLWGTRLADLLDGYLETGAVDAVSLSPIRALSKSSVEQIESTLPLNIRVIKHELDGIIGIPCVEEHGMEACNTRTSVGILGKGTQEPYGDFKNTISMNADFMETLHPNNYFYRDRGFIYLTAAGTQMSLPATLNAGLGHSCSMDCLASFYCTQTEANLSGCDFTTALGPCADEEDSSIVGGGPPNSPKWDWAALKCHTNRVTLYPCGL